MSRDQRRQVAIVVSFLITLAINIAANALQINGQRTAEISDRFDVFVIPAGYVFSIWGLVSPKWRTWWLLLRTVEFP